MQDAGRPPQGVGEAFRQIGFDGGPPFRLIKSPGNRRLAVFADFKRKGLFVELGRKTCEAGVCHPHQEYVVGAMAQRGRIEA